eukprot:12884881-Prorocentrum_lima.AAC.1
MRSATVTVIRWHSTRTCVAVGHAAGEAPLVQRDAEGRRAYGGGVGGAPGEAPTTKPGEKRKRVPWLINGTC